MTKQTHWRTDIRLKEVMPGGDCGLLSPWNVPGVVWVRSTGKRSDWCHSNSGVGRMHTELGDENGLILSLMRVLLGTCCVPSRVLFSGTQMKNVWSFPHRWWGNERVNSPILARSVHLCACARVCVRAWVHVCSFLWCQLAPLSLSVFSLWHLLAQCPISFSSRHRSVEGSQRTWSLKPWTPGTQESSAWPPS